MHLRDSNVLTSACMGVIGRGQVKETYPAARPDIVCLVPGGGKAM